MIIPGFSAYDITEEGVVTYIETGRVIKPHKVCSRKYYDYIRVSLMGDDGKQHACNVLRLLALTFLEKPEGPCTAKAKDGDNLHIALSNVEWVPYAYSTMCAWRSGRYNNRKPKANHCCTKESMELVLNTLEQLDEPIHVVDLSNMLEVPYSTARYTIKALVDIGKVKNVYGKGYTIA